MGSVSGHRVVWMGWEGAADGVGLKRPPGQPMGLPPVQAHLYVSSFDFTAAQPGHPSQQGLFQETATRAGPPTMQAVW